MDFREAQINKLTDARSYMHGDGVWLQPMPHEYDRADEEAYLAEKEEAEELDRLFGDDTEEETNHSNNKAPPGDENRENETDDMLLDEDETDELKKQKSAFTKMNHDAAPKVYKKKKQAQKKEKKKKNGEEVNPLTEAERKETLRKRREEERKKWKAFRALNEEYLNDTKLPFFSSVQNSAPRSGKWNSSRSTTVSVEDEETNGAPSSFGDEADAFSSYWGDDAAFFQSTTQRRGSQWNPPKREYTPLKVALADGSPTAKVVIVGEWPGTEEMKQGKAFVGPTGEYLREALAERGYNARKDVLFANAMLIRPPFGRDITPLALSGHKGYLKRLLDIVRPSLVITMGKYSSNLLRFMFDVKKMCRGPFNAGSWMIDERSSFGDLYDMKLLDMKQFTCLRIPKLAEQREDAVASDPELFASYSEKRRANSYSFTVVPMPNPARLLAKPTEIEEWEKKFDQALKYITVPASRVPEPHAYDLEGCTKRFGEALTRAKDHNKSYPQELARYERKFKAWKLHKSRIASEARRSKKKGACKKLVTKRYRSRYKPEPPKPPEPELTPEEIERYERRLQEGPNFVDHASFKEEEGPVNLLRKEELWKALNSSLLHVSSDADSAVKIAMASLAKNSKLAYEFEHPILARALSEAARLSRPDFEKDALKEALCAAFDKTLSSYPVGSDATKLSFQHWCERGQPVPEAQMISEGIETFKKRVSTLCLLPAVSSRAMRAAELDRIEKTRIPTAKEWSKERLMETGAFEDEKFVFHTNTLNYDPDRNCFHVFGSCERPYSGNVHCIVNNVKFKLYCNFPAIVEMNVQLSSSVAVEEGADKKEAERACFMVAAETFKELIIEKWKEKFPSEAKGFDDDDVNLHCTKRDVPEIEVDLFEMGRAMKRFYMPAHQGVGKTRVEGNVPETYLVVSTPLHGDLAKITEIIKNDIWPIYWNGSIDDRPMVCQGDWSHEEQFSVYSGIWMSCWTEVDLKKARFIPHGDPRRLSDAAVCLEFDVGAAVSKSPIEPDMVKKENEELAKKYSRHPPSRMLGMDAEMLKISVGSGMPNPVSDPIVSYSMELHHRNTSTFKINEAGFTNAFEAHVFVNGWAAVEESDYHAEKVYPPWVRVKTHKFEEEIEMLLAYAPFVRECAPHTMTGHNFGNFDINYFEWRLHVLSMVFRKLPRPGRAEKDMSLGVEARKFTTSLVKDTSSYIRRKKFASRAFGEKIISHIIMPGVNAIDTLDVYTRERKYSSYTLNSLAEKLLRALKYEVPYVAIPGLYRTNPITLRLLTIYNAMDTSLTCRIFNRDQWEVSTIEYSRILRTLPPERLHRGGAEEKLFSFISHMIQDQKRRMLIEGRFRDDPYADPKSDLYKMVERGCDAQEISDFLNGKGNYSKKRKYGERGAWPRSNQTEDDAGDEEILDDYAPIDSSGYTMNNDGDAYEPGGGGIEHFDQKAYKEALKMDPNYRLLESDADSLDAISSEFALAVRISRDRDEENYDIIEKEVEQRREEEEQEERLYQAKKLELDISEEDFIYAPEEEQEEEEDVGDKMDIEEEPPTLEPVSEAEGEEGEEASLFDSEGEGEEHEYRQEDLSLLDGEEEGEEMEEESEEEEEDPLEVERRALEEEMRKKKEREEEEAKRRKNLKCKKNSRFNKKPRHIAISYDPEPILYDKEKDTVEPPSKEKGGLLGFFGLVKKRKDETAKERDARASSDKPSNAPFSPITVPPAKPKHKGKQASIRNFFEFTKPQVMPDKNAAISVGHVQVGGRPKGGAKLGGYQAPPKKQEWVEDEDVAEGLKDIKRDVDKAKRARVKEQKRTCFGMNTRRKKAKSEFLLSKEEQEEEEEFLEEMEQMINQAPGAGAVPRKTQKPNPQKAKKKAPSKQPRKRKAKADRKAAYEGAKVMDAMRGFYRRLESMVLSEREILQLIPESKPDPTTNPFKNPPPHWYRGGKKVANGKNVRQGPVKFYDFASLYPTIHMSKCVSSDRVLFESDFSRPKYEGKIFKDECNLAAVHDENPRIGEVENVYFVRDHIRRRILFESDFERMGYLGKVTKEDCWVSTDEHRNPRTGEIEQAYVVKADRCLDMRTYLFQSEFVAKAIPGKRGDLKVSDFEPTVFSAPNEASGGAIERIFVRTGKAGDVKSLEDALKLNPCDVIAQDGTVAKGCERVFEGEFVPTDDALGSKSGVSLKNFNLSFEKGVNAKNKKIEPMYYLEELSSAKDSDSENPSFFFHVVEVLIGPGVIAEAVRLLVWLRSLCRKAQSAFAKSDVMFAILEGRQIALKTIANSIYGATGAKFGRLAWKLLGANICAFGRIFLEMSICALEEAFGIDNVRTLGGDTDSSMDQTLCARNEYEAAESGPVEMLFINTKFGLLSPTRQEFEKFQYPMMVSVKKRYAGYFYSDNECGDFFAKKRWVEKFLPKEQWPAFFAKRKWFIQRVTELPERFEMTRTSKKEIDDATLAEELCFYKWRPILKSVMDDYRLGGDGLVEKWHTLITDQNNEPLVEVCHKGGWSWFVKKSYYNSKKPAKLFALSTIDEASTASMETRLGDVLAETMNEIVGTRALKKNLDLGKDSEVVERKNRDVKVSLICNNWHEAGVHTEEVEDQSQPVNPETGKRPTKTVPFEWGKRVHGEYWAKCFEYLNTHGLRQWVKNWLWAERYDIPNFDIKTMGRVFTRGFETVRRDSCPYTKTMMTEFLDSTLMNEEITNAIVGFVRSSITMLNGEIDPSLVICSKQLTKPLDTYKNDSAPHLSIVRRAEEAGENHYELGSRIGYIFVVGDNKNTILSDRAYPPEQVVKEKMKIDYRHYWEKMVSKPFSRLLNIFTTEANANFLLNANNLLRKYVAPTIRDNSFLLRAGAVRLKRCVLCGTNSSKNHVCEECIKDVRENSTPSQRQALRKHIDMEEQSLNNRVEKCLTRCRKCTNTRSNDPDAIPCQYYTCQHYFPRVFGVQERKDATETFQSLMSVIDF